MSVQLEPQELSFRRPFTQEVSETLRLQNPTSDPIAFKVKTTAPKQYCVRPNSGRIESGQHVDIEVLLQAMKEDPPLEVKCRDKFLVQSVGVPANQEFSNVSQIWSSVEQTAKSSVIEKKIRVNFLPASGTNVATPPRQSGGGLGAHEEEPPAYSSPASTAVTPAQVGPSAPVGSVSKPESRPAGAKHLGDAISSADNPQTSQKSMTDSTAATASRAAGAVGAAVPKSTEDLKAQLAEAQATIAKMSRQAQESTGLRQRKVDSSDAQDSTATSLGMQQAPPGGVPVPIVAALCFLSFLIAYILF